MLKSKTLIFAAIATASVIANVASVKAETTDSKTANPLAESSHEQQVNPLAQITDSNLKNRNSEPGFFYDNAGETEEQNQVTSVSQLSDIQPTDWAFQALQSLVERYGCIAGYPNGTFRGNRALTRYEFAAGLNACLNRVNELIATATADLTTKQDLETIQKLQADFSAELATLRGRVDVLEARTSELEQNQFSTTTKLSGEAVLSFRSLFTDTDNRPDISGNALGRVSRNEGPIGKNTTLGYRVRLNLNTSFTGKDLLVTRLQASNIVRQRVNTFTNMGALSPDDTTGDQNDATYSSIGLLPGILTTDRLSDNSVDLDFLSYTFPLNNQAKVRITAVGGKLDDFAPSLNALDYGGAARGSISEFGQRNPIYRYSGAGAGIGLDYKFSNAVRLSLGYLGGNRSSAATSSNSSVINPFGQVLWTDSNGLFDGTFGAIAQLTVSPSKNIDLGFTYVRTFMSAGDVYSLRPGVGVGIGSHHSDFPLGGGPMEIDSYGFESSFRISPRFTLGGWVGFSQVTAPLGGFNVLGQTISKPGDTADLLNWAVTLAFPDLFKRGSLGGIVFGQPIKVARGDANFPPQFGTIEPFGTGPEKDYQGDTFHMEAFYRFPINENISITPGVVVILNPEYRDSNPTITISTLRTTFTF